jgi:hypothetical protein
MLAARAQNGFAERPCSLCGARAFPYAVFWNTCLPRAGWRVLRGRARVAGAWLRKWAFRATGPASRWVPGAVRQAPAARAVGGARPGGAWISRQQRARCASGYPAGEGGDARARFILKICDNREAGILYEADETSALPAALRAWRSFPARPSLKGDRAAAQPRGGGLERGRSAASRPSRLPIPPTPTPPDLVRRPSAGPPPAPDGPTSQSLYSPPLRPPQPPGHLGAPKADTATPRAATGGRGGFVSAAGCGWPSGLSRTASDGRRGRPGRGRSGMAKPGRVERGGAGWCGARVGWSVRVGSSWVVALGRGSTRLDQCPTTGQLPAAGWTLRGGRGSGGLRTAGRPAVGKSSL